jgi:drug/metabolite transporter (DMT)-like permease
MKTTQISKFNTFLMLILILFWGSSFVVVKILLNEGLTPIATATFRFLTAGILFITALLLKKANKHDYKLLIDKRDVPVAIALALTGVTFFFAAQYTGINLAGASIAAILVCLLSPILISIFSAKIFKEHLSRTQGLGIAIAATGTFTVIVGGTLNIQNGSTFLAGCLILLLTPVLWATYTLSGKRIMEKYDAFLIVAYVNILGGLLLVPFSWAEGSLTQILSLSLYGWLSILFLSTTCSLLGYYVWFHVLEQTNAASASSFLFAEPLIAVIFSIAFIEEKLNTPIVVGGLLIFVGVYLVAMKQARTSHPQKTAESS